MFDNGASQTQAVTQLKEEIDSQMRMLYGPRMKSFEGLYNVKKNVKAKRHATPYIGSLRMQKQTKAKGKVNETHIEAGKTYLETCWYDVLVCFSYDELKNTEADIVSGTVQRMKEASYMVNDSAALEALFGDIILGDPCALKAYKNICHIPHENTTLTPDQVIDVESIMGNWFPMSNVCVGVTNTQLVGMKRFDEWVNNDLLVGQSAFSGRIEKWGRVLFKEIPDYAEMETITDEDPFGQLYPVIPAVPHVVGGVWDNVTFVRFLPVWMADALDYGSQMGHQITPIPDYWKQHNLSYGVMAMRIDENVGFAMNNERGRAVICVLEENKALAESFCQNGGVGFGAPDPEWLNA